MSLPYYRFFPGDYARDTRHLSMLQHGAYRQLIDEYMVHGALPNDLQRLYRTCGAFNAEERSAVEYVLSEFFLLDGPTWNQTRCEREVTWQRSKSESAKESSRISWEKRRIANAKRMQSERISERKANQNQRSTKNPSPSDDGGFDLFWRAYPKKEDKQEATKAWRKLKPDESLLAVMLTALEAQKASSQWTKDDGQFIPYAATWINKRRWENDKAAIEPKPRRAVV